MEERSVLPGCFQSSKCAKTPKHPKTTQTCSVLPACVPMDVCLPNSEVLLTQIHLNPPNRSAILTRHSAAPPASGRSLRYLNKPPLFGNRKNPFRISFHGNLCYRCFMLLLFNVWMFSKTSGWTVRTSMICVLGGPSRCMHMHAQYVCSSLLTTGPVVLRFSANNYILAFPCWHPLQRCGNLVMFTENHIDLIHLVKKQCQDQFCSHWIITNCFALDMLQQFHGVLSKDCWLIRNFVIFLT